MYVLRLLVYTTQYGLNQTVARHMSSTRREKVKIYKTADEAVKGIPDASKLLVGGMYRPDRLGTCRLMHTGRRAF